MVICFFVCWSPYHTQRLVFALLSLTEGWNATNTYIHYYLYLASGVGYYLSCCVNPFVYCIMSKRFRRGLTRLTVCNLKPGTAAGWQWQVGGSSVATGAGQGTETRARNRQAKNVRDKKKTYFCKIS